MRGLRVGACEGEARGLPLHWAQGPPPGRRQHLRPLLGGPWGSKQRFAHGPGCVRGEPWPRAL
eukprot:6439775-Alexandrium_andersonii.AAC.1